MGSFRRPRPRFMSSPVLSDLARFHASSPSMQISNASVWNSVQSAVIKVFQGGELQTNELYTLNESIRWLLKTEMGSFITDYYQNQLLTRGLSEVLDQVLLHSGDQVLVVLADMWDRFFTEILPTLQAIFYPVQGIHQCGAPSVEAHELEVLVEVSVSPFLGRVRPPRSLLESRHLWSSLGESFQPEITITRHHASSDSSSLAPLVEQEGEAYLEKAGGVRRHTVANAHSDVRLLSASGRMHAGTEKGGVEFLGEGEPIAQRTFSGQLDMVESLRGGVISLPHS
uniref:Uncharacterized protein n=1 Tax=Gasterosteus aculeatus aculeatus TaxID=481459 RepID=A0AAQ4P707_GASAC